LESVHRVRTGKLSAVFEGTCQLIGAAEPDAATSVPENDAYRFERPVTFHHPDGHTSSGFIDLYKRNCFVLEAKQGDNQKGISDTPLWSGQGSSIVAAKPKTKTGTAVRGTKGWDDAMVRARAQAESYAKALPTHEGWPPFLNVTDVGHTIELFADFSLTGKNYTNSRSGPPSASRLTNWRMRLCGNDCTWSGRTPWHWIPPAAPPR
jgi:hypothetical protein